MCKFRIIKTFNIDSEANFIFTTKLVENLLFIYIYIIVNDYFILIKFGYSHFELEIQGKEVDKGNEWRYGDDIFM